MIQQLSKNNVTGLNPKDIIPERELHPRSVEEVRSLPRFIEKLREVERLTGKPYAAVSKSIQDALTFRRLQQLTAIAMLNPLWKKRIHEAGLNDIPQNAEEWQQIPCTNKADLAELFTGDRPGMVVPLQEGGFEVVASGGTSTGKPVEVVYSLEELQDTYLLGGNFMGAHILPRFFDEYGPEIPKWMITTYADYQMWSSGTMVGGVLQHIPGVNFIAAGPVGKEVFHQMMGYEGPKAILAMSQGLAHFRELAEGLDETSRRSFRVGLYCSGLLHPARRMELKECYPNLDILSYFSATEAEAIAIQYDPARPLMATVPGLHFIEVVDPDGRWVKEGEEGELVITRLHASDAPLLRYKLRDNMRLHAPVDTEKLKTVQIEYTGRSGDILHILDSQYPTLRVYEALADLLVVSGVCDLRRVMQEIQFINDRAEKKLTLLITAYDYDHLGQCLAQLPGPGGIHSVFVRAMTRALSIFNKNEAHTKFVEEAGYSYSIEFVAPGSPKIFRSELGKVPLLRDII